MIGISSRIIRPTNCTVTFGIPTCQNQFRESQAGGPPCFASLFQGGWPRYQTEVIEPLNRLQRLAAKLGVRIVQGLTLKQLPAQLCDEDRLVVILVSHWDRDSKRVELLDGMTTVDDFVDQVPDDFSGVLDFCVCLDDKNANLIETIRLRKPHPLWRFARRECTPQIWFEFYRILFWYLANQNTTYIQAHEDVVVEMCR